MKKATYFVFSLFIISYLLLVTPQAFAQTKTPQTNYPSPNTNPDVPNNLHNWTQNVMIEVMSALTCQLAGVDPINTKQGCLGIDSASGKIGFLPSPQAGGAIGFVGNMISTLYTPPLHTSDYFKDLASNFGISKHTFAQQTGTGFEGLSPLLGIWTAFRNIVYLFLVIIFVVIGLAIMLRIKIDPRTVMSIQNQIPKIIVGILAVTFSFAIAGFLIDMMWVFIYLSLNILENADPELASNLSKAAQSSNPFSAANSIFGLGEIIGRPAGAINGIVAEITKNFLGSVLGGLIGTLLLGPILSILAYIIIAIAVLTALFRLWIALIMAYVHILLDVVLAPFWIIGGIVPGSPISLSGWLRDLIANLAAFPAVIILFTLGQIIAHEFGKSADGQFSPPMIMGNIPTAYIGSIIGFGIVLMTPNVVTMLKTALKVPKVDTGGATKIIGGVVGAPGELFSKAGSLALSYSSLTHLGKGIRLPWSKKKTP